MKKGYNVLSVFDGMSCGRVALDELNIPVKQYYASEIDPYAITVATNNYMGTIQLGDVTKVDGHLLPKIDLLIGGSPCQGFSFAGKQLNFEDPRSKLFFEFVRLLKECKPKFFFLENVRMKKEYQDVISSYLGVEPVLLNSALVSAQNRQRLYWTNIPGYSPPEDRGILLKDIVHEHCLTERDKSHAVISSIGRTTTTREYFKKNQGQMVAQFNVNPSGKGMNGNVYPVTKLKANCLTTNKGEGQKISVPIEAYRISDEALQNSKYLNVKGLKKFAPADGKSYCLIASGHKGFGNDGCTVIMQELKSYIVPFDKTLQILDKEVARGKVGYFRQDSQANRVYYIHDKAVTLCGDAGGGAAKMGQYLFGCVTLDRVDKRQNDQRFNDGTKFYTLTAQDRHGILIEGYIRKLTPIECERLQTLPDNYTIGVSNSQRYKMLGNGWTVAAVKEFFKHLPPVEDLDVY